MWSRLKSAGKVREAVPEGNLIADVIGRSDGHEIGTGSDVNATKRAEASVREAMHSIKPRKS